MNWQWRGLCIHYLKIMFGNLVHMIAKEQSFHMTYKYSSCPYEAPCFVKQVFVWTLMLSPFLSMLRILMAAKGFATVVVLNSGQNDSFGVTYSSKLGCPPGGNVMFLSRAKVIICTSDIIKKNTEL